ncbi:hypothetical protein [Desulfoluna butyratoxydans]|uniref:Uncharacterized protein n=1 Tax=Desulfoluna butyratoxydans TaxID=231438 RepID=A0A4U8YXG9_9BACT|nr:hypothetical protein [Desulfoluna butyratoxydans]VFQ46153.1 hypothetical protein MSL71_38160 [Desulfoluna butyratoxydans]
MDNNVIKRLAVLNKDFESVTGSKFKNFFCPILYSDENVDLCKAHIVNKSFPNTTRKWTIQRKDVDEFYGANFESDFSNIFYNQNTLRPDEVLVDKSLSKKLKPKIEINGNELSYFYAYKKTPAIFPKYKVFSNENSVDIALKTNSVNQEILNESNWEIVINHDLRLAALVSLIKSAYLTLFNMLGYKYALSSGSHIGSIVLGKFYTDNIKDKSKKSVLSKSIPFFENYTQLVRPLESCSYDFKGTAIDNTVLICETNGCFWGCIVIIKIGTKIHHVVMPLFDSIYGESLFYSFLSKEIYQFRIRFAQYKENQWFLFKQTYDIPWPQQNVSLLP